MFETAAEEMRNVELLSVQLPDVSAVCAHDEELTKPIEAPLSFVRLRLGCHRQMRKVRLSRNKRSVLVLSFGT